jgi:hypothetical protein
MELVGSSVVTSVGVLIGVSVRVLDGAAVLMLTGIGVGVGTPVLPAVGAGNATTLILGREVVIIATEGRCVSTGNIVGTDAPIGEPILFGHDKKRKKKDSR